MKRLACALLLISLSAHAAEHPHAFWRSHQVAIIANWIARSGDAAQTCAALSHGARESFLPTQSCGGVVAFLGAESAAEVTTSWILHRRNHETMSQVPLIYGAADSGAAVGYSLTNFWLNPTPHLFMALARKGAR